MLELRCDEHFALEALRAGFAGEFWWQKLDHDSSVQGSLGREKEPAHPAGRELALDLVGFAESALKPILERSRHTNPAVRTFYIRRSTARRQAATAPR